MMNEFDWLSLRILYGQPIKFIEDSLPKPIRSLVLVNSLQEINTSIFVSESGGFGQVAPGRGCEAQEREGAEAQRRLRGDDSTSFYLVEFR